MQLSSAVKKFILFFNTVRYLKARQIFFQIKRKFHGRSSISLPSFITDFNYFQGKISFPMIKSAKIENGIFTCLNNSGEYLSLLDNRTSQIYSKLFLYNVHYFDFLSNKNSTYEECYRAVHHWIENIEYNIGPGWDAYPTSLRIVNWIKWALSGAVVPKRFHLSLLNQSMHLVRNIEYEIDGNHLFSNAKALIFYGLYFKGDWAERCLDVGMGIFEKELKAQILPDGGNFELSPMYHGLMLEDLIDLFILAKSKGTAHERLQSLLPPYIQRMLDWLAVVAIDPDSYPHFNDSTQCVAVSPRRLFDLASTLGFSINSSSGSLLLEDSGFCVLRSKSFNLLCDVGDIKADYIPGHTHSDTLSFELWADGNKLICNLGTSVYGSCERRLYERGNRSHSTLMIGEENSTNVWSGFRVGQRAKIISRYFSAEENKISASHDGYKKIIHNREWLLKDDSLSIIDIVSSNSPVGIAVYYHFAPGVTVECISEFVFKLKIEKAMYILKFNGLESAALQKSKYALGFNDLSDCISIMGSCCLLNKQHSIHVLLEKNGDCYD